MLSYNEMEPYSHQKLLLHQGSFFEEPFHASSITRLAQPTPHHQGFGDGLKILVGLVLYGIFRDRCSLRGRVPRDFCSCWREVVLRVLLRVWGDRLLPASLPSSNATIHCLSLPATAYLCLHLAASVGLRAIVYVS